MQGGIELEIIAAVFNEAHKQEIDIVVPWDFRRWVGVIQRDYFMRQATDALNQGKMEEARNFLIEAEQLGDEARLGIMNFDQLINEAIQEGKADLIPIGHPLIDKHLRWARGRVLIIAGKTGAGKSALLLNILFSRARKAPAGLISIEMDKTMLGERTLAQLKPEEMGVLKDAVRQVLEEREFPGYVRLGDMLIEESKLGEIQERLEGRLVGGELGLAKATRIIEDMGGRKPTSILQALGYRIEWHDIDFRSAKIHKKARL